MKADFFLFSSCRLFLRMGSVSEGFPGGSEVKASACNAGDLGLIPGLGRSPGEGNGNPLLYFCLGNPTDRGAWWPTVHGVAKSQTRLSNFTFTFCFWKNDGKNIMYEKLNIGDLSIPKNIFCNFFYCGEELFFKLWKMRMA